MRKQINVVIISSVVIILGIFIIFEKFIKKENEYTHIEEKFVKFNEGDLIFHTSKTDQSKAIQLATKSKYSHMGVIYILEGKYYVYEAIQTVQKTPLKKWIERGVNSHFVVKRLKNSKGILTRANLEKMKKIGEKYNGLDYDYYFEWSDDRIYCSELVWKMYKQAFDIEIGRPQHLKEFDLSNEIVQKILEERYGEDIPFDERVISPARMFHSDELKTIFEN